MTQFRRRHHWYAVMVDFALPIGLGVALIAPFWIAGRAEDDRDRATCLDRVIIQEKFRDVLVRQDRRWARSLNLIDPDHTDPAVNDLRNLNSELSDEDLKDFPSLDPGEC